MGSSLNVSRQITRLLKRHEEGLLGKMESIHSTVTGPGEVGRTAGAGPTPGETLPLATMSDLGGSAQGARG